MAKKDFSSGLDALLGGSKSSSSSKPSVNTKRKATKEDSGFGIKSEFMEKLEDMAYWDKRSIEDIVNEAVKFYLEFQVDLKPRPKDKE